MRDILNIILKFIKWPMALLMVLMFVPVFQSDMTLVCATFTLKFVMSFVVPMVGMIALWFVIPGLNGSHFAIFEHEFTHMIAALLTFHRPRSMKIEPDKGGSFGYYGEGNWFITLAPYFVPTFPIIMMLFSLVWRWSGEPLPELFMPVLGMLFGYHLVSNATQIHGEQTDFAKAGWIFSCLFLPTANLLTFGFVWAFAVRDWTGVTRWWHLVLRETELFIKHIF